MIASTSATATALTSVTELANANATHIELTVENIASPTLVVNENSTTTLSTTSETGSTLSNTNVTVLMESRLPWASPAMGNVSIAVAVTVAVSALACLISGFCCVCSRQRSQGQRAQNPLEIDLQDLEKQMSLEIEKSLAKVSVELEARFAQPLRCNVPRGARRVRFA
jgi:hypothetical protein